MSEQNDHAVDGIPLASGPSAERLNQRQLVDYRAERRDCLEWLLALGKAPDEGEGYARGPVSAADVVDHGLSYSLYFTDPDGNWLELTTNDHEVVAAELE